MKTVHPLHFPFAVVTLVGAAVCTLAPTVSAETNLTYAPATKVQVTDAFWKPLLDRNRAVTILHKLRMCREAGIVANFERVAGLRDGAYHGLPNSDEFLYKATLNFQVICICQIICICRSVVPGGRIDVDNDRWAWTNHAAHGMLQIWTGTATATGMPNFNQAKRMLENNKSMNSPAAVYSYDPGGLPVE